MVRGFFGIYGPDIALTGLVCSLIVLGDAAIGAVTEWYSGPAIGALLVARALTRWHDALRKRIYSGIATGLKWPLNMLREQADVWEPKGLLLLCIGAATVVALVVGGLSLSRGGLYFFGGGLAAVAIGLGGQVSWFLSRRAEWMKER